MVVLTVFALSTIGCSEEEKYNTDYQWLALSQATEQWNGSACNKLITLQENQVTDTIIKLTVSLYQNQAPTRYHRDNEGNSKMYIALADG